MPKYNKVTEKYEYTKEELVDHGFHMSAKYGDILRQLALTGVAICWLFFYDSQTKSINLTWFIPIGIFITAVFADVLYYLRKYKSYYWLLKNPNETPPFYTYSKKSQRIYKRLIWVRLWFTIAGYAAIIIVFWLQSYSEDIKEVQTFVYDKDSNKPLLSAVKYWKIENSVDTIDKKTDSVLGKCTLKLENKQIYLIEVSAEGYKTHIQKISDNSFVYDGASGAWKDFYLEPITFEPVVIFNDVLFDFNSDTLRSHFIPELDSSITKLNGNDKLCIGIDAHADAKGKDEFNINLSHRRAFSIRRYFSTKGIDSLRIFPRGFGESRPIATNDTEQGRQKNRRVEIYYLLKH